MSVHEKVRTIEIPITVRIYRYPSDEGGWMYDWTASNGDEPDEWFESEEEAVEDARMRYE